MVRGGQENTTLDVYKYVSFFFFFFSLLSFCLAFTSDGCNTSIAWATESSRDYCGFYKEVIFIAPRRLYEISMSPSRLVDNKTKETYFRYYFPVKKKNFHISYSSNSRAH
uniref:Uncharacterized protein n=1 Tax=Trichogramma kaykai TaxID=54128 RepID=A0ABD2VYW7_9HYME